MRRYPRENWTVIDRAEDGFAAQIGAMCIVASWDMGWEHVSVSTATRCPTWEEMRVIAQHFWPDEAAFQLHVPDSDHINFHPYCLHWWRPTTCDIPRPPGWMVGPTPGLDGDAMTRRDVPQPDGRKACNKTGEEE